VGGWEEHSEEKLPMTIPVIIDHIFTFVRVVGSTLPSRATRLGEFSPIGRRVARWFVFKPKIIFLGGKIFGASDWRIVGILSIAIWNISWIFGIFYI
jgi:hypothetical protein